MRKDNLVVVMRSDLVFVAGRCHGDEVGHVRACLFSTTLVDFVTWMSAVASCILRSDWTLKYSSTLCNVAVPDDMWAFALWSSRKQNATGIWDDRFIRFAFRRIER
jgi:hypothetical protein